MPARRFPSRPSPTGTRLGLRLMALTAPAVLIAAGVSACSGSAAGSGSSSAPGATASATTGADVAAGGSGTAAKVGAPAQSSGTNGSAQTAVCALADVKPTVIAQPQRTAGATRMAIVELTNVSSRSCRLEGWASVALLNAAGGVVVVPSSNVAQPGAPVPVDLPSGSSASAGIKWTVCDKASAECPTGNTLMIGVPKSSGAKDAELTDFPAAERSDITIKQLEIGSLQPSAQGVVAW
ncbi:DUF4232 domain-containing protein [Planosporangium thailandense]|uniref:DUF4232 domain-containing protein n=1 Tax=Planosporangium thailandense TaxID=765197 RepID=A0ABX0XZ07_9ACTN|nr:DUF4232 domain-containing protein [Planosporangium thailandense]NJC71310.1 DUF4232 domain-containing protein [Planosporangium thailandense]